MYNSPYGCTTWMLTKCIEKKLDGNCVRMIKDTIKQVLEATTHKTAAVPPISKTIQIWQTRHAGHCWRSKNELISDILLWTPSHGCACVGWPTRIYLQQLCMDTGCCLEDLLEVMDDRDKWWERVREIHVNSTTWWWWWYIYIYIYDL